MIVTLSLPKKRDRSHRDIMPPIDAIRTLKIRITTQNNMVRKSLISNE